MLDNLKNCCKNWWILLIVGILLVIASIAVLCTPASGVTTLAIILTIVLILTGILGIIFVICNRKEIPSWGWNLVLPILTLIVGVILAFNTAATMVIVVIIFAIAVLFKSIEAIVYSISMSKVKGSGWGWTLAAGIIGLLLSFFLFANPLFTGLAMGIFVGIALLFMGIESIAMSIQMSKVRGTIKQAEKEIKK